MKMLFLNIPFTLMKVILVLMRVYIDHNETNLDTNEWIFSVNEQQKGVIVITVIIKWYTGEIRNLMCICQNSNNFPCLKVQKLSP